jgi:hypothetical protein
MKVIGGNFCIAVPLPTGVTKLTSRDGWLVSNLVYYTKTPIRGNATYRHRSATLRPASPSLTIARICLSLNLRVAFSPPRVNGGLSFYVRRFRGGGSH